MAVIEVSSKISRKYFQRKTKDELIDECVSIASFCGDQRLRMDDLDATIDIQMNVIKKYEKQVVDHMNEMCSQSLDPETHEKWEQVLSVIMEIRKL